MDIDYLLFLQQMREALNGAFDPFFLGVTLFGESLIILLTVAGIFWCIDKRAGSFLMLSSVFGLFIGQFLKITCCVYRPWLRSSDLHPVAEALEAATGFSFPSGHSISAMTTWGGLAVVLQRTLFWKWVFIVMVLLVGFSRNYLGVHTPQDVLAGFAVGGVTLYAMTKIMKKLDEDPKFDRYLVTAGIVCGAALLLLACFREIPIRYGMNGEVLPPLQASALFSDAFKSVGFSLGVLLGWLMERRWVKFDEKRGTLFQKLFRFAIGIGLLLLLTNVLLPMLNIPLYPNLSICFDLFITGFFITGGYPWFVKCFQKNEP